MMSQKGTDVCSENCKKIADTQADPTIDHSAGVMPHRGVAGSPTPAHRTTTFKA